MICKYEYVDVHSKVHANVNVHVYVYVKILMIFVFVDICVNLDFCTGKYAYVYFAFII